ncbi:hypothetical protein EMIHUDRAFT_251369, partial [Emiliania huxleyi CCMP1516]|uniref:Deacetylase sirtuin-type domain-containing protein n=2 Tax=Emiliania huxleyi TaxID=2903 RepID=A0A0D3KVW2_EMIH1
MPSHQALVAASALGFMTKAESQARRVAILEQKLAALESAHADRRACGNTCSNREEACRVVEASVAALLHEGGTMRNKGCNLVKNSLADLFDALARIIRRGDPVVFVTGSGLSAPSGIPTFRGAEGVWAKWVLEWGTRAAFLADPRGWYDNFWIPAHVVAEPGSTSERTYEPSAGHFAVAEVAACRQTNVH